MERLLVSSGIEWKAKVSIKAQDSYLIGKVSEHPRYTYLMLC